MMRTSRVGKREEGSKRDMFLFLHSCLKRTNLV